MESTSTPPPSPTWCPFWRCWLPWRREKTRIYHAQRLRLKESDRLAAVAALLQNLGGSAEVTADGLLIQGTGLSGGRVESFNDHRIAMAAAVAGTLASQPVTILGAEAVEKSYPGFLKIFKHWEGVYEQYLRRTLSPDHLWPVHAPAIGVTMEGLPAGIEVDEAKLQAFLERRAPGRSLTATSRREPDQVEFLAGLVGGRTCGAPLTAIIRNTNTRSKDYDNLRDCPRPGHADYPAEVKFGGYQDVAGGGHFSGRLTAPLCIAGGIALQVLSKLGITVAAHIQSIGPVDDDRFDLAGVNEQQLQALLKKPFPVLRDGAAQEMEQAILAAKSKLDSLGGVIECAAVGVPAGWGDPMFGGMENRIAQMVFGIPAIRGIEFGLGFPAARLTGSEHNDPYYMDGDQVKTRTNRHGRHFGRHHLGHAHCVPGGGEAHVVHRPAPGERVPGGKDRRAPGDPRPPRPVHHHPRRAGGGGRHGHRPAGRVLLRQHQHNERFPVAVGADYISARKAVAIPASLPPNVARHGSMRTSTPTGAVGFWYRRCRGGLYIRP